MIDDSDAVCLDGIVYFPFLAAASARAVLRRAFRTSSLRLRLRLSSLCLSRMNKSLLSKWSIADSEHSIVP